MVVTITPAMVCMALVFIFLLSSGCGGRSTSVMSPWCVRITSKRWPIQLPTIDQSTAQELTKQINKCIQTEE